MRDAWGLHGGDVVSRGDVGEERRAHRGRRLSHARRRVEPVEQSARVDDLDVGVLFDRFDRLAPRRMCAARCLAIGPRRSDARELGRCDGLHVDRRCSDRRDGRDSGRAAWRGRGVREPREIAKRGKDGALHSVKNGGGEILGERVACGACSVVARGQDVGCVARLAPDGIWQRSVFARRGGAKRRKSA